MGAIADKVATMRGCSLAQIVDVIAQMEVPALPVGADDFAEWWEAYGHKANRKGAEKAYRAARKRGHSREVLLSHASRYRETRGTTFWLHGATFLNGERWNDAPAPSTAKPSKTSELRNDLRQRIENGEGSQDTGSLRRLAEREPDGRQPQGLLGRGR